MIEFLFAVPKEGRAFARRLPTHSLTGPGLRPLSFFFESLRKPLSLAFGRRKGRRTRGFDARKGKERPLCFVVWPTPDQKRRLEGDRENQWKEPSATGNILPKTPSSSYRPRAVFREGRTQSLGKTLRLMTSTTVVIRATMRKAVSSPVWRAMKPIAAGPARIPA